MQPILLSFRLIDDLSSPERRAVGFLEGHPELNAGREFEALRSKDQDRVRSGMDRWCDGQPGPKKWFHGWNEPEYRECMVFKLNEHRFYGFKCHPLPNSNPAFLLCVLNIHVYKRETETDDAELDRVNQWRTNVGAQSAIARVYPEYGRGKCKLSRN
jgi:hypothetical protein